MTSITKISAYRSGPPRFGNRPHQIDNTVRTYKLTPEQLERLKNGESLDDILKDCEDVREEKPVAGSKIELTVEEYVKMRKNGMDDEEIAREKGLTEKQLYHWKYFRRKKINELMEQGGDHMETIKKQEDVEVKVVPDGELDKLRGLLAEKDEECNRLKNEVQRLNELTKELCDKAVQYKDKLDEATEELKLLRLLVLRKLQKDTQEA